MTAQDIINKAAKHIGVLASGATFNTEEYTDCLEQLNILIQQWDILRLNIYTIALASYPLTSGKASYTIGTGGAPDISGARPVSIRAASIVDASGAFRFPVQIVTAEEYAAIREQAATGAIPRKLYYDNDYPLAKIYLWPVPSTTPNLELSTWEALGSFASLTTTFDLPPGYQNAIEFNLAVQLAPMFGRPISADLARNAADTLAAIQALNQPPSPGEAEEGQAEARVAQSTIPPR